MDHVVKESLTCKVFHTPNRAAERVVARVKDASLHQGLKSECSPVCHHGGPGSMAPLKARVPQRTAKGF